MRFVIAIALVAGCASSLPQWSMPSGVLDHQDPGADTSSHPTLWSSSARSWLDSPLAGCNDPSPAPHGTYYRGCHGCAVGDGPDLTNLVILAAALVAVRRRRPSV